MKRIATLILLACVVLLSGCAATSMQREPIQTEARSPCFCRLFQCWWHYEPYRIDDFYADRTRPMDYDHNGYYMGDLPVPEVCIAPYK